MLHINKRIAFLAAAAMLTLLFAGRIVGAQDASSEKPPALRGHDPVSYFSEGKPREGNRTWQATHEGETYLFASAANRDAFVAAPKRYAPQYAGYCAYGATRGYKAAVDPAAFKIVDGKLYLNYSAKVQGLWEKDIPGFIKLADEKWPETAKTTKVIR
jgi:YHS domain-containing protein